jgi:hypothetical protein
MKPFIEQKYLSQVTALQNTFPLFKPLLLNNFSTEIVKFGSKCCSYEDVELLRNYTNRNITLNGAYFISYRYFDGIRARIKEMFSFLPSTITDAKSVIDNVREEFRHRMELLNRSYKSVLLVCVHIRRGDFVNTPEFLESRKEFTIAVSLFLISLAIENFSTVDHPRNGRIQFFWFVLQMRRSRKKNSISGRGKQEKE